MADGHNDVPVARPVTVTPAVLGLSLLNEGMSAQIGLLLALPGFPATDVLNLLCEHVGKILALAEPQELRNQIIAEIRRNLPAVMNRHIEARMRTAGGVLLPGLGERLQ